MKTEYNKWFRNCIIALASLLLGIFVLVLIVDPFFHYHKPITKYRLIEPRYTNDGISRYFDYDAVITGTSMVQNFKNSQFDYIFDVHSVKMPFAGAGYEEIAANMSRTLKRNSETSHVLWAIDYNGLLRKYDWSQYNDYPTYLYDENPLNDAPYILNKSMLYHALLPDIMMTIQGGYSTDMDEYAVFEDPTGASHVYSGRHYYDTICDDRLSDEEVSQVEETFQKNFVDIIEQYPNTVFHLYFTPYSIYFWENMYGANQINRCIEAQQIATEMLLKCPNVELSSFFEATDIICNLDNYMDEGHYSETINVWIMNCIGSKEYLVTKENYRDRIAAQKEFYLNFDYDEYFSNLEQELGMNENSN